MIGLEEFAELNRLRDEADDLRHQVAFWESLADMRQVEIERLRERLPQHPPGIPPRMYGGFS